MSHLWNDVIRDGIVDLVIENNLPVSEAQKMYQRFCQEAIDPEVELPNTYEL